MFAARTTVSELAPKERVKWALFVGDIRAVSISTEQLTAAEELKVHGTNACQAVPALFRLAKRDALSGQMAIEVIAAAGCDSLEVVEGLVQFAAENQHDNSFVAIEVLASLASRTSRIERQLLRTLERTDDLRLANTILFVFRLSGFKDSDAVPILQRYAEYEETKDHALAALKGAHAISN
ncbi:MAG TPA: hypothetical protein VF773_17935 [Verrucomicrobiae bacterium]